MDYNYSINDEQKKVYIAEKLSGKLNDGEPLYGYHCLKTKCNGEKVNVRFYVSILDVLEFEGSFNSYSKRPDCYA